MDDTLMDDTDATITNPEFCHTLRENDDFRVLEYIDAPGGTPASE
jgi:hypothetical protein